jgi:hypothetical protein
MLSLAGSCELAQKWIQHLFKTRTQLPARTPKSEGVSHSQFFNLKLYKPPT